MGARIKGRLDLATMFGWNAERFARTKTIKPLAEYLKPVLSPEQKREEGARKVLAALRQKHKKGGG